ncbi:hypothetical protein EZH22_23515 [Xanthobacter dioxanivorans]|uniref:Uncharacterized protein n=1 Tax=Xanthobacter dioxanivorans TaxID=2528964 RepID=A0A974PMK1_9HYPH|nr:hypothetical protein [Xanthobacter dioxanivorans]QRG05956.1 hypothetical protein EZH22_23515 [Xanthobacter dioxanivorans]
MAAEPRRPLAAVFWGFFGLALLAAAWQAGAVAFGPFVLPTLTETGHAMWRLVASGTAGPALGATIAHALGGCLAGGAVGLVLGIAGGIATARAHFDLPETMAWIVLAVLVLLLADVLLLAPLRGWRAMRGGRPAAPPVEA